MEAFTHPTKGVTALTLGELHAGDDHSWGLFFASSYSYFRASVVSFLYPCIHILTFKNCNHLNAHLCHYSELFFRSFEYQ